MSVRNLALLPELFLLLSTFFMWLIAKYRSTQTPKTFYTFAKYVLFLFVLGSCFVFNHRALHAFGLENSYKLMLKIFLAMACFLVFFLSCKWFLNKNKSSFAYYALSINAFLGFDLMISASDLLMFFIGYVISGLMLYFLLFLCEEDYDCQSAQRKYLFFVLLFDLIFAVAMFFIWSKTHSFEYQKIQMFFAKNAVSSYELFAVGGIYLALFFLLGLVPLHFCQTELAGLSIMPVYAFRILLPSIVGFSALVYFSVNVFSPLADFLCLLIQMAAFASVLVGALAVMYEENLRRFFFMISLYSLGIVCLCLLPFSHNGILSAFICFLVYWLALFACCAIMFGIKSNGEYLSGVADISGIFASKPKIAAFMLVFIVSLAGSPPMLGFLGKLQAVDHLMLNHAYGTIAVIMLSLLFVLNAFSKLLQTIFFAEKKRSFDRVDKSVYLCLYGTAVLFVIGILNPKLFMERLDVWLEAVMR